MTATIIVYILIVTLPLVIAAVLAEQVCKLWNWPVRSAWIVTALLILMIGGRTVARQMIPPQTASAVAPVIAEHLTTPHGANHTGALASSISELTSLPHAAAISIARMIPPGQNRILAILWGLMSLVVLVMIAGVHLRVGYARSKWKTAYLAGHRVRVAPHTGPAVVGLFRTEIVVPASILQSLPEDAQLIVMHETEHRNANDPLLLAAMWGVVALIPWHPGAWYCLARARLAIEIDCDARVVRRGASVRGYTQLLLNQARTRLGAPLHLWLGATSLLEPSSNLERRLDAMVPARSSVPAHPVLARFARSLSYLAIALTIAAAACESRLPTENDIATLDATSAQKNVAALIGADTTRFTYYVNGKVVSADEARAIPGARIAAVTVDKSNSLDSSRIRIITTDPAGPIHIRFAPKGLTAAGSRSNAHVIYTSADTSGNRTFTGTVYIDGVASNAAVLKTIDPQTIKSVEVIKGKAAMERYPAANSANGVILITLKH